MQGIFTLDFTLYILEIIIDKADKPWQKIPIVHRIKMNIVPCNSEAKYYLRRKLRIKMESYDLESWIVDFDILFSSWKEYNFRQLSSPSCWSPPSRCCRCRGACKPYLRSILHYNLFSRCIFFYCKLLSFFWEPKKHFSSQFLKKKAASWK